MIPKAERDADAAILAAATGGTWITVSPRSQDGGVCLASFGGLDAPNVAVSLRVVGKWHMGLMQEQAAMPWEQHAANAKAAAHAVNRLPAYIEAMAEMERVLLALVMALPKCNCGDPATREDMSDSCDECALPRNDERSYAASLRDALRILRGGQ